MDDLPPMQALCADEKTMLKSMLLNNINTPSTSSMGRLFDAISALIGIRSQVTYEGQAAIELENCIDPDEQAAYELPLDKEVICLRPLLEQVLADYHNGLSNSRISSKFHNGIANLCVETAKHVRMQSGTNSIGLSGGVWQNMSLLILTINKLRQAGFTCLIHHQVPTNDGGLSLGQCSAAAAYSQQ